MSVLCFVKNFPWEGLEFIGLNCQYRTAFLPQAGFAVILLYLFVPLPVSPRPRTRLMVCIPVLCLYSEEEQHGKERHILKVLNIQRPETQRGA